MTARDYTDSFRVTETGFTIQEDGQPLTFDNRDVFGIGVHTQRNSDVNSEEIELAVRRADGKPQLIRLTNQSGANETNLLSNFRQSILASIAHQSKSEINTGGVALGPHWEMNITSLTNKETDETILLSECDSMGWSGDEFVVWETSESPFIQLGRTELNTYLLAELLRPFVPRTRASGGHQADGLGELLAELKDLTPKSQNIIGTIVVLGVVAGLGVFYLAPTTMHALISVGAIAAITAALGFAAYYIFGKYQFLRHFEHGIQSDDGDVQVTLDWDDVRSLTSKWVDNYQNGVYTGTHVSLTIADEKGHRIEHACGTSKGNAKHEQLQNLRSHASQSVANWMIGQLQEVGRVQWTSALSITAQGLEHTKKRGSEPELYAFERISNWKIGNGTLKICIDGNWISSVKLDSSSENFYPGLAVIESLLDCSQLDEACSEQVLPDLQEQPRARLAQS